MDVISKCRFTRLAFLGFLVLAAFALPGCDKQSHPARSTIECRLGVVEPVLGPLALDVLGQCTRVRNSTPLRDALLGLGLNFAQISEIVDAWHACAAPDPLPFPDAGVLELPE